MGKRTRRKQAEPETRGLTPGQAASAAVPARVEQLAEDVEADGGRVVGSYRDPLGGSWQLLVLLPVDQVAPTPFQRDLSEAHVKRLAKTLDEIDRFLDPILVVRREDGSYWTPNGNHRLAAVRRLGGRSIAALLVPEQDLAYRILALNTEKAHNLKERSLEVIRMARELADLNPEPERSFATIFEEPALLTLGICYEQRKRFAGSAYHPLLRRTDAFLARRLPRALEIRAERARRLLELEDAVSEAVTRLRERGFESPYLRNFVVARIDPTRFQRTKKADFDETLTKMTASARRLDAGKVRADQLARSGGPLED